MGAMMLLSSRKVSEFRAGMACGDELVHLSHHTGKVGRRTRPRVLGAQMSAAEKSASSSFSVYAVCQYGRLRFRKMEVIRRTS